MFGFWHFVVFVIGCWIGWAVGTENGNWVPLVLWAVGSAGGWVFSCWRHPTRPCRLCHGTGRHKGWIFGYADRACLRCGGTPRFRRLGSRIFGFSEQSPS